MDDHHAKLSERIIEILGPANVELAPRELAFAYLPPAGPEPPVWRARPGSAAEIAELVRLCGEEKVPIHPMGTASRRLPSPTTFRARVLIDLGRMNHVVHLDETSLVVTAQAGLVGLKLEEMLLPRGLTIGDFPPAALRSSLGGLLSVRTAGKSSPRHGFLEDAVLGVSAVLGTGRTVHTRIAPRRATGPDLARALLGSEGTLGIVTAVTMRIHRRAETRYLDAYRFASLDAAIDAMRAALRADARPAACRIFDGPEAMAHLSTGFVQEDEAVLTVATAGPTELAAVDREIFSDASTARGGTRLPPAAADVWWRRRTGHGSPGPIPPPPAIQLTAPSNRLAAVHAAIVAAAATVDRRARAHISRFDDDGACLFVTLLNGDRPDPGGPARTPVLIAARAAGAFGVGERDEELGPYLGWLRRELDPNGVLNPDLF